MMCHPVYVMRKHKIGRLAQGIRNKCPVRVSINQDHLSISGIFSQDVRGQKKVTCEKMTLSDSISSVTEKEGLPYMTSKWKGRSGGDKEMPQI